MTTINRSVVIDAPRSRVWEALRDIPGIQTWNPGVPSSHSTSETTEGMGATRHCDFTMPGSSVEERVVEWDDGHSYTIEIYDGTKLPPFKTARATLSIDEVDGRTVTHARMEYDLKMGVLGRLMNVMMVRSQFGKSFSGLLAGLKHHVETGEQVTADTQLDLAGVEVIA